MKRYDNIMQDNELAPKPDNNIWLKDSKLYYHSNGKWVLIGGDVSEKDIKDIKEQIKQTDQALQSKADTSDIPDVSKFFDKAVYKDERIYFQNNGKDICFIEGALFIKDGMVDRVFIEDKNLVVTFNTDAEKETIKIPITDIFNPDNYYDKKAINEFLDAIKAAVKEINDTLFEDPTNGHDYVDMGEAGIWATCNIGASKPEEAGLYFAWGETEGYIDASIRKFTYDNYKFGGDNQGGQSKYNSEDGLLILQPEDDAASINMGGSWKVPTKEQFQKLIDSCNIEYIKNYNGYSILLFKLKTDESKQVVFPFAGAYYGNNNKLEFAGKYWCSTIKTINGQPNYGNSDYFEFTDNSNNEEGFYAGVSMGTVRCAGQTIRGFMPSIPDSEKYLPKKEAEENYYTKQEVDDKLSNIDIPEVDLSEIESKLEGVTKAADSSKLIQTINVYGKNLDVDIEPDVTNGYISLNEGKGIKLEANINGDISFSADTDYLATRQYVDEHQPDIAQESGDAEDKLMSQKAITELIKNSNGSEDNKALNFRRLKDKLKIKLTANTGDTIELPLVTTWKGSDGSELPTVDMNGYNVVEGFYDSLPVTAEFLVSIFNNQYYVHSEDEFWNYDIFYGESEDKDNIYDWSEKIGLVMDNYSAIYQSKPLYRGNCSLKIGFENSLPNYSDTLIKVPFLLANLENKEAEWNKFIMDILSKSGSGNERNFTLTVSKA